MTQEGYDLHLLTVGSNKLAVVKLVKEITGKGLKEAKEFVDSLLPTSSGVIPKVSESNFLINLDDEYKVNEILDEFITLNSTVTVNRKNTKTKPSSPQMSVNFNASATVNSKQLTTITDFFLGMGIHFHMDIENKE